METKVETIGPPSYSAQALASAFLLSAFWLVFLRVVLSSAVAQGCFILANKTSEIDALIYDSAGKALEGTNYLAMLYVGTSPEELFPAGRSASFRAGTRAGEIETLLVELTNIQPAVIVWTQVRAWDARLGATYEGVARLAIGGYGESESFQSKTGCSFQGFATPLLGLKSFKLRPVTGIALTFIRTSDKEFLIQWHGLLMRYQLQQTTALDQPWQNVGEPTTAVSYTNTISGTARFYRIVGLPN